MNYKNWIISSDEIVNEKKKKKSRETVFSVGNGYICSRGFFEEDFQSEYKNGGIYISGIFAAGDYDAWIGRSREMLNASNIFRLRIYINGIAVNGVDKVSNFLQELDMKKAVYNRSYMWDNSAKLTFSRFADRKNINQIGQQLKIKAIAESINVKIFVLLDSDVINLNEKSFEPYPVQPGKNHIVKRTIEENKLSTLIDDIDNTELTFIQKVSGKINGKTIKSQKITEEFATGELFSFDLAKGEEFDINKLVYIYSSQKWDNGKLGESDFITKQLEYDEIFNTHIREWEKRWSDVDIEISTATNDQTALRYDLFELMCSCPEHTDCLSIGARGLTGEMYEGCVFWDNEIFQLPFFTYTNPKAARNLLRFRYNTLNAAREHAKNNWFEGAMYPWQVSEKGIEQTRKNVGAFYAIHIVSDIAYAIMQYYKMTEDDSFLIDGGAEILVETARFWVSRCDYSKKDGHYHIRAVRGPNEYDVFVNNNAYTNVMASNNLKAAVWVVNYLEKLGKNILLVSQEELGVFKEISEKLVVPREGDLILEDDAYLDRRPLDLKKAKPTPKRIIDSTLPYEALPLYQITKQSDTVTLMCLNPDLFSLKEKEIALNFYEPRTAHDSSLSYAPYGWLAAELGQKEMAYDYFTRCAYLDIVDLKLNTVSGLHFANFGGTWQIAIFGFGGVSLKKDGIHILPKLPDEWDKMKFSFYYKGTKLKFTVTNSSVSVIAENLKKSVCITALGEVINIEKENYEYIKELTI